jgi:hypothetical protein
MSGPNRRGLITATYQCGTEETRVRPHDQSPGSPNALSTSSTSLTEKTQPLGCLYVRPPLSSFIVLYFGGNKEDQPNADIPTSARREKYDLESPAIVTITPTINRSRLLSNCSSI